MKWRNNYQNVKRGGKKGRQPRKIKIGMAKENFGGVHSVSIYRESHII